MEKKHTAFLAVLWVFLLSVAAMSEAQTMDAHQALSAKQQRIIPIARLVKKLKRFTNTFAKQAMR